MKPINLGWGNAVAVRQAFLETTSGRDIRFGQKDLEEMDYPPHEGDQRLIELTRSVIERQVGPTYNHILLTNGAAGATTLAMRAYHQMGYDKVLTRPSPFFPIYPSMIRSAGMTHVQFMHGLTNDGLIGLIDSPTNPHGTVVDDCLTSPIPVVWDAVYHSRVYTYGNYKPIWHNVITGSYSKLLGLNGLRTGWVATHDPFMYERLKELVTAEYCGLSSASTKILLETAGKFTPSHWMLFESTARYRLDCNREEWSKLEKFFGNMPVPHNGMFYYGRMDDQCKKLIEASGITWTSGSSLGAFDDHGRFNLGQDCKLVRQAVKIVLKNDRR